MCFFDFSIQFKPSNRSLLNLHLYHNICIYLCTSNESIRIKRERNRVISEKDVGLVSIYQCIVLSKSLEIFRDLYSCSRKYILDNFYVYIVRDV